MKICVSSYSFGGYISKLGILGVIDKAAEMGFEAIEFVDGDWTNGLDIEVAKACKKRAEEKGLEVANYCIGNDFLDLSRETFEQKTEYLKKQVDFAKALGSKGMRHDVAYADGGKSYDEVVDILADGCRMVTEYAAKQGIFTCSENHGFFSQDSDRVEKLVRTVNNPNFGLLVDIGNFMCADEDPVHAVGITAKYAKHVHVKDFLFKSGDGIDPGEGWFETRGGSRLRGAILGNGVVPVKQCLHVLKKFGYDGYVSVEFEGLEDNLLGIRLSCDYLKRCLALI